MSDSTSSSPRVVKVAAGVESAAGLVPVRDARHEALDVLIGKWINEGHTVASAQLPSLPILTSDVYEWAPGGFFVVHSAYGTETATAPRSMTASVMCTPRGWRSMAR